MNLARFTPWIRRRLPRVFALSLIGMGLMGCAPGESDQVLRVGMELAYPPFEMRDEAGRPTGISVDLAHALGKFLDREVVIENIAFDGLIPSLKTGKIDLIISSMTASAERAKSIDFSAPYLKTGLCLLVGKDSSIRSYQDLSQVDAPVAVKNGTTGHQYAVKNLAPERILVLDSEASCVLEVVQGKAAAFIYDQMSTLKNWQRNEATTSALLVPFQEESWAVGIRKGRSDLVDGVNRFLATFQESGGFDRLAETYLADEKAAFDALGVEFFF